MNRPDPSFPPWSFTIDPFTWQASAKDDSYPFFIAITFECLDKRQVQFRGSPHDLERLLRQALEAIHQFAGTPG